MYVRRGADYVELQAPAKLNLFLEVLGKRLDGFHEIETVMAPVSLYDTLIVHDDPSGRITLRCERSADSPCGERSAEQVVPEGTDNIVVRALEALRRRAGIDRGAEVRLVKRIPVAAGMAGGSTDAAAALAAANVVWKLRLPNDELADVAATLGSDIPFFFAGAAALCRGRGERIEPLSGLGVLHFVVVAPPVGLSTAQVYRACRPAAEPRQASTLVERWRSGDLAGVGRALHNRLQPAAEELTDWIARLGREVARCDCLGRCMSGSGTSYFALCRDARQARRIAARLAGRGLGRTFALRTCLN